MFDWAELGAHHRLHIHFGAADAMLKSCNLELAVEAEDLEAATQRIRDVHVMLYVHGLTPFSVQMAANYSINQYAGINSRRSPSGKELLPEGMREGITSKTSTVEIFPAPYISSPHIRTKLARQLSTATFILAVNDAAKWDAIRARNSVCRLFEKVIVSAPTMPDIGQSLLHIWTGLEALFPKVQTELSFRIALYLAQLQHMHGNRAVFFERARLSYRDRSAIAHGSEPKRKGQRDPWLSGWLIMLETARAIIERNGIPSEEDLVREILGVPTAITGL